mmetsp:Transcript_6680/g.11232  ORF Transcript_6680/g.11232 Transcript_6680/m.11232 type:complete len:140 (-) Transcript_6680:616-1035(-)
MRESILTNCLDEDKLMVQFESIARFNPQMDQLLNQSNRSLLEMQSESLGSQSNIIEHVQRNFRDDQSMLNTIYVQFINSLNQRRFGIIVGLYRVFTFVSFFISFSVILKDKISTDISSVNEYTILIPLIGSLYDNQLPY